MAIDPHSSVPVYSQIVEHIRRAVAAGVYRPGEAIPSLRALAVELTVNPNTVQRAFEALEREGSIQARKGLGMFVTENGAASAIEPVCGRRLRKLRPWYSRRTGRQHAARDGSAALSRWPGIAHAEVRDEP